MKSVFIRFVLLATVMLSLTNIPFASAETTVRPFDFQVSSECHGCVSFSDFISDLSILTQGTPARIRFYYSEYSWQKPDEQSPYFELPMTLDQNGQAEIPPFKLGNWSATYYTFAYGLVSENGTLLWFMKDDEFDEARHSVTMEQ